MLNEIKHILSLYNVVNYFSQKEKKMQVGSFLNNFFRNYEWIYGIRNFSHKALSIKDVTQKGGWVSVSHFVTMCDEGKGGGCQEIYVHGNYMILIQKPFTKINF